MQLYILGNIPIDYILSRGEFMRMGKASCLVFILLLYGCDGDSSSKSLDSSISTTIPSTSDYIMAVRLTCMGCHKMDKNNFGPSIKEISEKHKDSDINELVSTVKTGRKDSELTWGSAPKPRSSFHKKDIKKVIEWMLNK